MKVKSKQYYDAGYIDAIIVTLDEISQMLEDFEKRISSLEENKSE
jgi:hypothetical protein